MTPAQRDPETIELLTEFLQEGADGVTSADELLLGLADEGPSGETIHALFRVFHSIKGVSSFLELSEVTKLAHTTETLLDGVRKGVVELEGPALDAVFDATAMMRRLLDEVGNAVGASREIVPAEGMDALLARIEDATRGDAPAAPAVPEPTGPPEAPRPEPTVEVAAAPTPTTRLRGTVKLDVERVDRLVETIGELVIVESMVGHAPEITALESVQLRNTLGQLSKICRDLQDVGMRMRMVPVRSAFQKMARMVRDLGHRSGKTVRIVLSGESTEVDRSVVEQIEDPLVHLIRNAVDHGVEGPAERTAAGKPAEATIRVSARHEAGCIAIEVADDGKGLDREAILRRARSQGLIEEVGARTDAEIFDLVFRPGFSTAARVTETSGRGVGLDVVRRNVEGMRGHVAVASTCGQGTTFKLILPLTLAIIDGILVACGAERYVIPTLSIVESVELDKSMILQCAGAAELIRVRDEVLPLLRLDRLFGVPGTKHDPTHALVVIVMAMGRKAGLLVDDVLSRQQIVIKSLGPGLEGARHLSGAAILSDGRVGLILNVDEVCGLGLRAKGAA